jgi:Flp pilus assembly protein TadB
MAETSLREGVREVAQQARPSDVNAKLEEAVQNQPLLPHLLNFKWLAIALVAGLVVAAIVAFLLAPVMGGIALLLVFFGTWVGLGLRDYGHATERASDDDDEDDE